jgi:hypothetical protein
LVLQFFCNSLTILISCISKLFFLLPQLLHRLFDLLIGVFFSCLILLNDAVLLFLYIQVQCLYFTLKSCDFTFEIVDITEIGKNLVDLNDKFTLLIQFVLQILEEVCVINPFLLIYFSLGFFFELI